jgi:hypothetical protein
MVRCVTVLTDMKNPLTIHYLDLGTAPVCDGSCEDPYLQQLTVGKGGTSDSGTFFPVLRALIALIHLSPLHLGEVCMTGTKAFCALDSDSFKHCKPIHVSPRVKELCL